MKNFRQTDIKSKAVGKRKTRSGSIVDDKVLDMNELTFSDAGLLIYLTGFFRNGNLIGFWSHSPWGTCHDQEQGWCIINSNTLEVVDMCESKTSGASTGLIRQWRKKVKEENGPAKKLLNDWDEQEWKITDC